MLNRKNTAGFGGKGENSLRLSPEKLEAFVVVVGVIDEPVVGENQALRPSGGGAQGIHVALRPVPAGGVRQKALPSDTKKSAAAQAPKAKNASVQQAATASSRPSSSAETSPPLPASTVRSPTDKYRRNAEIYLCNASKII